MRFHVTPADLNQIMSERHQDNGIHLAKSESHSHAERVTDNADMQQTRQGQKLKTYGRMRNRDNPFEQ